MKKILFTIVLFSSFTLFCCDGSKEKSDGENAGAPNIEKLSFESLKSALSKHREELQKGSLENCFSIVYLDEGFSFSDNNCMYLSILDTAKAEGFERFQFSINEDSKGFGECSGATFFWNEEKISIDEDFPENRKKKCLNLIKKYGIK